MIHVFYKRYPFGHKEAFAADELEEIARRFDSVKIYNFADNTNEKRDIPENCELICLYDKKRVRSRKLLAALKLFSVKTFKELLFMHKCGYKLCPKNIRRIYMYYFYDGFVDQSRFEIKEGDILYSYWLGDLAYPVSKLKQKNPGAVYVSRAHGFDLYAYRGYNPFRREIIGQLDRLYCINSSGRDDILEHYSSYITPEKVKTAYLGVVCPEKAVERKFDGDNCVIVTCSNIIKLKRLDLLIEALAKLDIKVLWVHFGSGNNEGEIKKLAEEKLSCKNNIEYDFKGQTPHDEILRYYLEEKVDLLVNCSDYEGIPVSIMEAMAYGIPCIARNVGGVSEVVNNENGILMEKEIDSDGLCRELFNYSTLSLDEKINKSRKASQTVFDKFNCSKNYSMFVSELKEIEGYGKSNAE